MVLCVLCIQVMNGWTVVVVGVKIAKVLSVLPNFWIVIQSLNVYHECYLELIDEGFMIKVYLKVTKLFTFLVAILIMNIQYYSK